MDVFEYSKFQDLEVSKLQRFKIAFYVFKNIDPIFKIFKNLLDGSSGCSVPAFYLFVIGFPPFDISLNNIVEQHAKDSSRFC